MKTYLLSVVEAISDTATAASQPSLDWLGPVVTSIGAVLVAAVSGAALVFRRRQDRKETVDGQIIAKSASEADEWDEVRQARAEATKYYKLYRTFEDLYYSVSSALRYLARKTHEANPLEELPKNVIDALAMKPPEVDSK